MMPVYIQQNIIPTVRQLTQWSDLLFNDILFSKMNRLLKFQTRFSPISECHSKMLPSMKIAVNLKSIKLLTL